ncbi:MAG TPA: DUF1569 domain-containing protein [Candidatus Solibacter sp.]|jgi:hypothetical protein|nr:DUF1569 domain-containing protein [Candidatus Solibacter sp.]
MDFYLDKLQRAIRSSIAGMSGEEMNRHPPEKWSAAEILEHLYLTYTGSVKGFERALAAGKPLVTAGTIRHRMRTAVVTRFGYLPEGRKAPPTTVPRGVPSEKVVAEIDARIAAMDEIIARCEEQFGARENLLDHPVLGPLTGEQWRKFHWVHGRHHVKQIQRLRREQR